MTTQTTRSHGCCSLIAALLSLVLTPTASGQAGAYRLTERIMPENSEPDDFFGGSIDMFRGLLAVRSRSAYRDRRDSQIHLFTTSENVGDPWDEVANDTIVHPQHFSIGQDLAVSGGIGSPEAYLGLNQNNVNGVVRNGHLISYSKNDNRAGPIWTVQGTLSPSELLFGAAFGRSVDVDGTDGRGRQMIVGASGGTTGGAFIYERGFQGAWNETGHLTLPEDQMGDPIGRRFGTSVAIDGRTALVSAILDDNGSGTERLGSVYFFERDNQDNWEQTQKVFTPGGAGFGAAVALDGDTALVTALNDRAVFLYQRGETEWELRGNLNQEPVATLWGSRSVAISGDALAAGYHDGTNGWVDIYRQDDSSTWIFSERLLSPSGRETDYFGFNVAFDSGFGSRLVVSDPGSDPSFVVTTEPVSGDPGEVYLYELTNQNLAGDLDGDGRVSDSDLAIWRRSYGSTTSLVADLNENGIVDVADYTMIVDQLTAPLIATTVPEPAAVMLLTIGGTALAVRRR